MRNTANIGRDVLLLQFALNFGTDMTPAPGFGDGKFDMPPTYICPGAVRKSRNRGIKSLGFEFAFPYGDDAPGE